MQHNDKRKGFTLIELLAVIIILAVIAVIVTPVINGIIENSRRSTYKSSVDAILDSASNYIAEKALENNNGSFSTVFTCDGVTCNDGTYTLHFSGSVPVGGTIVVNSETDITANYITDGRYCVTGQKGNLSITKSCSYADTTAPIINSDYTVQSTSNSIVVVIPALYASDPESNISNYKIDLYNGSTLISEKVRTDINADVTEKFDGLTKATEYKVVVVAVNGSKLETQAEKTISTGNITNPAISYTTIPTTAVNGYYQKQVANISFDTDNVDNPEYFVKSTAPATSSISLSNSCGTTTMPGDCTNIDSTTSLNANTWYEANDDLSLTYTSSSTNNTVYAITYDGTNYSGASTGTILKVDGTNPTVTLGTTSVSTNSFSINYTLTDKDSGIDNYSCRYGTTNGNYNNVGTATLTNCSIAGLPQNTTYYYQICAKDKVGNESCQYGNTTTSVINNPVITYSNTPTSSVNGYYQKEIVNISYNNNNITNPIYYVKTTLVGTTPQTLLGTCGSDTMPGTCTTSTDPTVVEPNIWYKVAGSLSVTYANPTSVTATIYALTYDGLNYSSAATGSIAKIDTELPSATFAVNSATLSINLTDAASGANYYCVTSSNDFSTCSWITVTNGSSVNATYTIPSPGKYYLFAKDGVGNISYTVPFYATGTPIYFNVSTGATCSSTSATSLTGTKTGCMKFYAFNDSSSNSYLNMILNHNTTALVIWNSSSVNSTGPNEVLTQLKTDTNSWVGTLTPDNYTYSNASTSYSINYKTNGYKARLITANELARISGNTGYNSSTTYTSDYYFFFDSNSTTQTSTTAGQSKYGWLFDYTYQCTSRGCNVEDNATYNSTNVYGYWTSDSISGTTTDAWEVPRRGTLDHNPVNSTILGLRPVISVNKSIIN